MTRLRLGALCWSGLNWTGLLWSLQVPRTTLGGNGILASSFFQIRCRRPKTGQLGIRHHHSGIGTSRMTLTPHHGHHLADHGPSSSSHSTPKVTPCVSALASPTAPLSRAASPRPLALRDVDDDSFAPSALAQETDSVHAVSPSLTPSLPAPASQDENHFASPAETSHSPQKLQPLGETLVISGGSGFNDLLGAAPGNTTYVMPISDNGGSSSEIIRTLSGPSIGDIRSRLVRLIPLTTSPPASGRPVPPPSNDCLHALLSYRLPTVGRTRDIKAEWLDLLEGKHRLWKGIEADRKEVVRGFLVHFQSEILRRAHRNFNLRGLSVGNAFLSAAQMFFRSIQSAIFLFSATTLVAGSGASVLPCINTNHTATIAAELEDGSTIVGQCEISHPAPTPRSRGEMVSKTDMGPDDTLRQAPRGLRDGPAYSPAVTLSSGIGTPSSTIFDPLSNVGSDLHAALRRSTETAYQQWRSVREAPTQRTTVGTLQDGLEPDEEDDAASQAADIDDPDEDGVEEQAGGNIVFSKDASKDEEPLPSRIRGESFETDLRKTGQHGAV